MHARNRQGGYIHGDTAVQVQCPDNEEEPSANDRPAKEQSHVLKTKWRHALDGVQAHL